MWGGFGILSEGGGWGVLRSGRVVQAGLSFVYLFFRGNVQTDIVPTLPLVGIWFILFIPGWEQCLWWWKWVRAVSSQSLLCVPGTVLVPGSWSQGAYIPMGDTDKKKLTTK